MTIYIWILLMALILLVFILTLLNWENKCYRGGHKHNFEPRYGEASNAITLSKTTLNAEELRKLMYRQIYIHDVCKWCGSTTGKSK